MFHFKALIRVRAALLTSQSDWSELHSLTHFRRLGGLHAAQEWVSSLTNPLTVSRQWDFVNITDPKQRKDRRIQKLVRVKAQKHVRKLQKEQESKSVSPESYSNPTFEAASARDTPSPLGKLALRDPGVPDSYPIPMQPYMRALLDRCQYLISYTSQTALFPLLDKSHRLSQHHL